MFTEVMYCGEKLQGATMVEATKKPPKAKGTTRSTVSFPSELHDTLEKIAKDKNVSFGWVVRDAAQSYVKERWPLLAQS